jgi:hypothetical protein
MAAATAATANHVAAQLWNPHASDRIEIWEIEVWLTTAGVANLGLLRSTGRGATPGATLTTAIANSVKRDAAAQSGAILDLAAFGTQPTLDSATAYMWRANLPAAIGAGVVKSMQDAPIVVLPGTGVVLVTPTAVAFPIADISFTFED